MPPDARQANGTTSRQPQHRQAILVVDPDDATRAFYRQAFALEGWDVLEASDGREALTKAFADRPTLVLAEIWLPFLDGCALSDILRRDAATSDVPILILTADARPAAIDRARRAGADIVLTKPALIEDLVTAMRRLLPDVDDHVGPIHRTIAPDQGGGAGATVVGSATDDQTPRRTRFVPFSTTSPPAAPPALTCPSCNGPLTYERSHVGGVSHRDPDQWDYYSCPAFCGSFQYRQRTRTTRAVESGPHAQSGQTLHIPRLTSVKPR
jgi:CheY-like chemotaxis protein